MYIFELIYTIVKKISAKREVKQDVPETEEEICEHIYFPIDSTKQILACTKCGKVIRAKDFTKNDTPKPAK